MMRAQRTITAHGNCIRNPNRIILPPNHALVPDSLLDRFPQIHQVHIARVSFPPHRRNADMGTFSHGILVGDASGEKHSLKILASAQIHEVAIDVLARPGNHDL